MQIHPISPDPNLTRIQICHLKLPWGLTSQQQPKQWYLGGKSPHRWERTYLITVTCQVTLRHSLPWPCHHPQTHGTSEIYELFSSECLGTDTISNLSTGLPGNQILLTHLEGGKKKKGKKKSQKHLSSDSFASWKRYSKYSFQKTP